MLEAAKQKLESISDIPMKVVAGYLVPENDEYLRSKLPSTGILASHRVKMCELSVADSPWISVCSWSARGAIARGRSEVGQYLEGFFVRNLPLTHQKLCIALNQMPKFSIAVDPIPQNP
jgi:hypothetical protein